MPQSSRSFSVEEPGKDKLKYVFRRPLASLDPEPPPVRLLDPVVPLGGNPPIGVDPRLPTMFAAFAPADVALDADQHRGRALLRVAERVPPPAAGLALLEDVRATGTQWMVGWATMTDHRHQERCPRRLEIADDRDAVEFAVQDQE